MLWLCLHDLFFASSNYLSTFEGKWGARQGGAEFDSNTRVLRDGKFKPHSPSPFSSYFP